MQQQSRIPLALWALATALAVATLWIVPYLPTNDGPHHIHSVANALT